MPWSADASGNGDRARRILRRSPRGATRGYGPPPADPHRVSRAKGVRPPDGPPNPLQRNALRIQSRRRDGAKELLKKKRRFPRGEPGRTGQVSCEESDGAPTDPALFAPGPALLSWPGATPGTTTSPEGGLQRNVPLAPPELERAPHPTDPAGLTRRPPGGPLYSPGAGRPFFPDDPALPRIRIAGDGAPPREAKPARCLRETGISAKTRRHRHPRPDAETPPPAADSESPGEDTRCGCIFSEPAAAAT
jgi:hypothetical protein